MEVTNHGHPILGSVCGRRCGDVGFGTATFAQQFDAPYYALKERKAADWKTQDLQIDGKLTALEKRYGKKPNIVYILTDDIGWGELGWQGGGKHRGTP